MEVMRKSIGLLLICAFLVFCDEYPPNPVEVNLVPDGVIVQCIKTDYIPVNPPAEGMTATKVNVLSFQFAIEGKEVKVLEFYGRAIVAGPPEGRICAVHFRTDSLGLIPEGTDYPFNIIDEIEPDSTYLMIRSQYPTNEYSPFVGDRGKIVSIEIDEVCAYRKDGTIMSVSLVDSLAVSL
jgi:hypothetical protein